MDETPSSLINWVLGAIAALAVSAAGVIKYLYSKTESANASRISELPAQVQQLKDISTRCEDIRVQLHIQVTQLTAELTLLKSEHSDLKGQFIELQRELTESNRQK